MCAGVKGTRDFYPNDWSKINYLFSKSSAISRNYGFEEYEAPIMEYAEMWLKKSGGEIPAQMYTFEDKNGDLLALRPEMTPSLARMISEKHKELKKPIRWFSFPRCFRYEQPQKGRLREFFQYNADIIGDKSPILHAEIIALSIDMLKSLGLTSKDFTVKISNRKIVDSLFRICAVKNKLEMMALIDKRGKVSDTDIINMSTEKVAAKRIFSYFGKDIDSLGLDTEGIEAVKFTSDILNLLSTAGYGDYIEFDLSIVRGLGYYTDTVFEAFDKSGKFRAILGGGSYSNLISDFDSSAKLEGIGFGMGDAVLSLLLESKNLLPKYTRDIDYYIIMLGSFESEAFKIASKMRANNNSIIIGSPSKNLSKQIQAASDIGARKVVIIGEKDLKDGVVTIKDLVDGTQKIVNINSM